MGKEPKDQFDHNHSCLVGYQFSAPVAAAD